MRHDWDYRTSDTKHECDYRTSDTKPGDFELHVVRPGVAVLACTLDQGGICSADSVSDRGSGVDPLSLQVHIDGNVVSALYTSGRARVPLGDIARGRHALTFTVSDYQETKNMENVARILPNTRTLRTTFVRP